MQRAQEAEHCYKAAVVMLRSAVAAEWVAGERPNCCALQLVVANGNCWADDVCGAAAFRPDHCTVLVVEGRRPLEEEHCIPGPGPGPDTAVGPALLLHRHLG